MKPLAAFCLPILLAPAAAAQDVLPSVIASIHDEPVDGLGDSFNTPLTGLLRKQSTRQDRAVLEYDLTSHVGAPPATVTFTGRVSVNNAADNGVRSFDFVVYGGNGAADLTDFQIVGVTVGSGSYHPPSQSSFDVSFDVTSAVHALLGGGNGWIGVRCEPTSEPNFPSILDPASVLTLDFGGPGTSFCSGDGSGTLCPCGNQGAPGRGCANGAGSGGARLSASGSASVAAADLVLSGEGLTPSQPGLYFQGNNAVAGGAGGAFGDGLRCAGGSVARLQVRTASAAGTSSTTANLVLAGGVAPGDVRRYQIWYRDPAASPCGSGFNLTQGLEIAWLP